MEQNQNRIIPESATDEPGSSSHDPADSLAFDPVPLRYRSDGLTPEKQRDYVEALADCGLVNVAAARVQVSPQAVNRTRRRADAKSFDLACAAAQRFGARRLHATAWERAIEGTVRRHYYHGELKSEEIVFDHRLLIYLLGKTEHLLDEPDEEARQVCANWEPYMDALERGLLSPVPDALEDPDPANAMAADPEPEPCDDEVWEAEDRLWTNVPAPYDFDGFELGRRGSEAYMRELTAAEEEVWDERCEDAAFAEEIETSHADRLWVLTGGSFYPREAETSKLPPERGAQRSSAPVAKRCERPGETLEDRVEQPEEDDEHEHDRGKHDEADQT